MVWTVFLVKKRLNFYKLARSFKSKKLDYFANLYLKILNINLLEI